MKGVIISACIAVALVAGSLVYTSHIKSVSAELGAINDRVMLQLIKEDYEGASGEIGHLVDYLNDHRTLLAATGDHADFDKIEMNISEMEGYTNGRQKIDAMSKCKVLAFMFEHLPKNYEMKLENIL